MTPVPARGPAGTPFALAALLILFAIAARAAPAPPAQPAHGPGGADYRHARVLERSVGIGARGAHVFVPDAPPPSQPASVVVFLHGWGALDPSAYRAWIDHLVRRGHVVVWPNYQDSLRTPGEDFLPNAIAGVHAALADLRASTRMADLHAIVAAGHSAGGVLAAELAAVASANGLPPVRAVLAVEPGDGSREGRARARVPHADYAAIPAPTQLLVVVGGDDHFAGEQVGLDLYAGATRVAHRAVLELESDAHGEPALLANHAAAGAAGEGARPRRGRRFGRHADFRNAGEVDALDWYGTWKLLDGLIASDPSHPYEPDRAMGRWSDGVAVTPMRRLR